MFQPKVFKCIFLASLSLFIVVGFVFIKSNTVYSDEVSCGVYEYTCGNSEQYCAFCSGEFCCAAVECLTCFGGTEYSTNYCDSLTGDFLRREWSGCDNNRWCDSPGCPNTGCYNDWDCAIDDGCTDYYCSDGACRSTDLCGGGGGSCGDGNCSASETSASCPDDCSSGTTPGINVTIDPILRTINQGDTTTFLVSVSPDGGYTGTVTLSGIGACGTNNITCSFLDGNTADLSLGTVYKTLQVDTTSGTGINTYTIIAQGTDGSLTGSASATLEVKISPVLFCDSTWRNVPGFPPATNLAVSFTYNSNNYFKPFTTYISGSQGGVASSFCYTTLTGGGCGEPFFSGAQIPAPTGDIFKADQYAGYPSIYVKGGDNNTYQYYEYINTFYNLGSAAKLWNTSTSLIDDRGRLWEFKSVSNVAQYKCGPVAPPTCSSAGPVGWTTTAITGTHDVFAYGVSSDVTSVYFPTWGDTGGQDDIVWYPGTNLGGGTWKASVNLANHKAGNPEYGNFNVHVYMNSPSYSNQFCGYANFTRNLPNQPPTVPSVTVTEPDYCVSGPSVYVNWTYSDPDGDPQSAYQVQIDDLGSAWNLPYTVDSGKVMSSGTSYFASGLAFDITYKARVRVWDSNDNVSAWKDSGSWKTPKHAYPYVDFTYTPSTDIPAKQPVQFTDQTTFYDGGGTRTWSWLFGDSGTSTQQSPSHTYNLSGLYQASLTATDKDSFSCSRTKPITIQLPVPVWKEVSPR